MLMLVSSVLNPKHYVCLRFLNRLQWLAWEVAMRQLLPLAIEEEPDHSSTAGQQQQLQNGTSKQQDVRAVTV